MSDSSDDSEREPSASTDRANTDRETIQNPSQERAESAVWRRASTELQVLVVGCGIAGLTLARTLRDSGLHPIVLETDDQRREDPVVLAPTAVSVLDGLGVGQQTRRAATPLHTRTLHSADATHRQQADDDTEPPLVVQPGVLRHILRETVPKTAIRTDTTPQEFERTRNGIEVTFTDGVQEMFDLVVGDDGVDSRVRQQATNGPPASFTGTAAWTFTHDDARHDGISEFWPTGETALVCWQTQASTVGRLVTVAAPGEYDDWDAETLSSLTEAFQESTGLDVDALAGDIQYRSDYRLQSAIWTDSRVALVGNAAHARHPLSGVGATLALEDADTLADLLVDSGDVSSALDAYGSRRQSRFADITALGAETERYPETALTERVAQALSTRSVFYERLVE
jgi:2-polyprenyl-6-methoxyphenol hydroxylase-like FAD-dependent oxidoreductase